MREMILCPLPFQQWDLKGRLDITNNSPLNLVGSGQTITPVLAKGKSHQYEKCRRQPVLCCGGPRNAGKYNPGSFDAGLFCVLVAEDWCNSDQKESSLPNPMVEPLPRTTSSYGDDMGWVVLHCCYRFFTVPWFHLQFFMHRHSFASLLLYPAQE